MKNILKSQLCVKMVTCMPMPTDAKVQVLQIHKAGKKQREHVAAEPAPKAIANVRSSDLF